MRVPPASFPRNKRAQTTCKPSGAVVDGSTRCDQETQEDPDRRDRRATGQWAKRGRVRLYKVRDPLCGERRPDHRARAEAGLDYGVHLRKTDADIVEVSEFLRMSAKVPLPYNADQSFLSATQTRKASSRSIGMASPRQLRLRRRRRRKRSRKRSVSPEALNGPVEAIKSVDVCPHRRGFFKPSYSPAPLTPTPTSEDEVATLIIQIKTYRLEYRSTRSKCLSAISEPTHPQALR